MIEVINAGRSMASKVSPMRLSRRTLLVVAVVSTVAVVVAASVAYYLDVHRYPSEETPLVLQSWGISWTRESEDTSVLQFESLQLWWSESPSRQAVGGSLNNSPILSSTAEFELPNNLTTLYETYPISWISDSLSDPTLSFNAVRPFVIFIVDENENGLFDIGDIISLACGIYENGKLTRQGFLSDTEHGIALEPGQQFMYAIHRGELYAWADVWHP